jgi:hypothetical protein
VTFDVTEIAGYFPMLKLFTFFLYVLQVLHAFWFYLIMKVAIKSFGSNSGGVKRDDRSESDFSSQVNEKDSEQRKKD